jgi:hypothetical protein
MFIERVAWIDPERLIVWRFQHHKEMPMVLIEGETQHPDFEKWSSLRMAIGKARQIAEAKGFVLIRAEIEGLKSGEHQEWTRDNDNTGIIVHVGIVTNPASAVFAGAESATLIPGQVIAFGSKLWRSAVNQGDTARWHLVLRFVKSN